MGRIYFLNNKDLTGFFIDVKQSSKLSWSKIAKLLETTRSMLDNYRKGKILLSEERFQQLLNLLDNQLREKYLRVVSKKDNNWGQVIGGNIAYENNKKYFDIGRKTAHRNCGVKYDFDINMPLSKDLCEFLGAIIGDGCTNKYGHSYQTIIAGDKLLDKDYYNNILLPICLKLFKINPKIITRQSGIYMLLYSKRLFELLTIRFKIPAGVKCYCVQIPSEIFDASETMLMSVLRGMFDTDGGVGLDKRKTYKKPYIRLNYTSASFRLIEQVHVALNRYNIPHSIHEKNDCKAKQIQINGETNVRSFVNLIGFSNQRHIKKIAHLVS
jgi:intein/homing endonuclease